MHTSRVGRYFVIRVRTLEEPFVAQLKNTHRYFVHSEIILTAIKRCFHRYYSCYDYAFLLNVFRLSREMRVDFTYVRV